MKNLTLILNKCTLILNKWSLVARSDTEGSTVSPLELYLLKQILQDKSNVFFPY